MDALTGNNLNMLLEQVNEALLAGAPPIAAFDADGTLWNTDMGENFFDFIIKNDLAKHDLPQNPWEYYFNLRDSDNPPAGYLWLAQILADLPLATVREWNRKCIEKFNPMPVFKPVQELIKQLKLLGMEVYVVTASPKWAVEAAAQQYYEIPYENVIGVTTKVVDGVLTNEQDGPVTWKQGKVDGILLKTDKISPLLCAGNTTGDLPLLQAASKFKIAVHAAPETEKRLFESEQDLLKVALQENWLVHSFQ